MQVGRDVPLSSPVATILSPDLNIVMPLYRSESHVLAVSWQALPQRSGAFPACAKVTASWPRWAEHDFILQL
jgi:hypothetical protein